MRTSASCRYTLWGGQCLDATNHWVLNQFNAFVEIGTLGSDDCLVDDVAGHAGGSLTARAESRRFKLDGRRPSHLYCEHDSCPQCWFRISKLLAQGGGGRVAAVVVRPLKIQTRSSQFNMRAFSISEGEIDGIEGGQKGVF